jgi:hypothetical protein
MGRSGRGRTTGRTARGDAAEATWPDKGRGPSTHEMEGPIRSSSAGHRYLMLSVRTTRSTTKPDTRLKSQLPSSPCAPGCPPDGSVFGSERFLRLSRAGAQEVSASNFKIFWLSTNCPQLDPSYPPVDPLSPHEIHRQAAYPVPGALFGGPSVCGGGRSDGDRAGGDRAGGGRVNGGRGSGRQSGSAARRLRPRRGPAVPRR